MPFNKDQTSKRVASEASGLLRSRTANRVAKSVAGSALAQAPFKKGLLSKAATQLGKTVARDKTTMGSLMKSRLRSK